MYHIPPQAHISGPPLDIEAMLHEISMARPQMAYQISSGSSVHRQRPTRVMKPCSAGNSPQHLQRRRTSASQRLSKYRPDPYSHTTQTAHSSVLNPSIQAVHTAPRARPMSWHPSTMPSMPYRPHSYVSTMDFSPRHSMNSYGTVAINGMPTPMTQPDLCGEMPFESQFSLDDPVQYQSMLDQQMFGYLDNSATHINTEAMYHNNSQMHPETLGPMQAMTPLEAFPSFPSFSPDATQTHSWTNPMQGISTHTAPPTPDLLPIQKPAESVMEEDELDDTSEEDSKELIGMGLYDDMKKPSSSTGSLMGGMIVTSQTEGKGLKLEETWEPPEESDADEDEGDEADGEDEDGEEEDEDECSGGQVQGSIVQDKGKSDGNSAPRESGSTTETFRQMYGDMSNESFFFDNSDDNYAGMSARHSLQSMTGIMEGGQSLLAGGHIQWR